MEPTKPTNPPTPSPKYILDTPPEKPKKSFLKSPLFIITVILLLIFISAYYFIYSNLENKVSQLTGGTKTTPTNP